MAEDHYLLAVVALLNPLAPPPGPLFILPPTIPTVVLFNRAEN